MMNLWNISIRIFLIYLNHYGIAIRQLWTQKELEVLDKISIVSPVLSVTSLGNLFDGTICVPCIPRDLILVNELLETIDNQTLPPRRVVIALSETSSPAGTTLQTYLQHLHPQYELLVISTIERQNAGQNRNRCRKEAVGKYVSWFDADDRMLPQRLQIIMSTFQAYPYLDTVVHTFLYPSFQYAELLTVFHIQLTEAIRFYDNSMEGEGGYLMPVNGHHGNILPYTTLSLSYIRVF